MAAILESELVLNKDGSVYHLNLKPGIISDTIITVGDPGQIYNISKYFDELDFEMNRREFITQVGRLNGKKVTVISTGMGTDNIEIVLSELDALVNIDFDRREPKSRKKKLKIIRLGTSGSLQEDIKLGAHLVSNYAVGFDSLMRFYNLQQTEFELDITSRIKAQVQLPFTPYCVQGSQKLIEQIGYDMVPGNTITTPGFYAPQRRKLRIDLKMPNLIEDLNYFNHNDFWLTNIDMETAGYYALARLLGHEMVSVNAIVGNRIRNKFSKNPNKIMESLICKVVERI